MHGGRLIFPTEFDWRRPDRAAATGGFFFNEMSGLRSLCSRLERLVHCYEPRFRAGFHRSAHDKGHQEAREVFSVRKPRRGRAKDGNSEVMLAIENARKEYPAFPAELLPFFANDDSRRKR